jgi:pimeloyl-ACP methyl ester carboxylesterase
VNSPPDVLATLVARFDSGPFDAPGGRARIRLGVRGHGTWDATVRGSRVRLSDAQPGRRPDAEIIGDPRAWERLEADVGSALEERAAGRLVFRGSLHVGVGFLAAVGGMRNGPESRLRLSRVRTRNGRLAIVEAGQGPPVVMLHGLGGTKGSFMPTISALAPSHRAIAVDLPGFGDSDKPLPAAYDAPFFARWVVGLLDALDIERAHFLGHSMGGRVALELGMSHADRVDSLTLMTPSLAWLRERRFAGYLRLLRPELGLLQVAPRSVVEAFVRRAVPGANDGWAAVGVDEFLRAYLTPRGRVAFYAAARNIYLEESEEFWDRLAALSHRTLFLWGRRDTLVPIGFARHVRNVLPAAEHVELDCGHVPQFERPAQAHAAIAAFLRGAPVHGGRARSRAGRSALRAQSGRG